MAGLAALTAAPHAVPKGRVCVRRVELYHVCCHLRLGLHDAAAGAALEAPVSHARRQCARSLHGPAFRIVVFTNKLREGSNDD